MNRVVNLGIPREKPFLSSVDAENLRKEIDQIIDAQLSRWNKEVPGAKAHESEANFDYVKYKRGLAETALRIRMLRVVESKAISEMAKRSPEAAKIWSEYEADEMLHDEMFIQDLERAGVSRDTFHKIEPYLSTKLLVGFFSYLIDHEGPLGVVTYSYLVEYVNVKLEPLKLKGLKKILGEEAIAGQIAHSHTDVNHDHPSMVWSCLRYLVKSEKDIESLKIYLEEFKELLVLYMKEINEDKILEYLDNSHDVNEVA